MVNLYKLQVVEISKMQNILTEHVEIQGQQIEEIQETILAATENVQEGNEQVCLFIYFLKAFPLLINYILFPLWGVSGMEHASCPFLVRLSLVHLAQNAQHRVHPHPHQVKEP